MSNLTTTGTTGYPGVLDTRTALTDGATGDLIVANHPNGLGAAVLAIETELGVDPAGTTTDVVTRLNVSQNSDGTIKSSVIAGGTGAVVTYSAGVFTIGSTPDGPGNIQNISFSVTIGTPVANAFRIALLQRDGSTPAAIPNAVRFAFRNATATTGDYAIVNATAATTLDVSVGSTLGFAANETGRIYVGVLNNAGTVELIVSRKAMSENRLWNTTAEGGAGAADDDDTIYSTAARTGVAIRYFGYIEIQTGSTAGNWSNAPTLLHLLGPGSYRTGDIVTSELSQSGAVQTSTATVNQGDATPLISAPALFFITPSSVTSALNQIRFTGYGQIAHTVGAAAMTSCIFDAASTTAIAVSSARLVDADNSYPISISYTLATASVGSHTWALGFGGSSAGTMTLNGFSGGRQYGGKYVSFFKIEEIFT